MAAGKRETMRGDIYIGWYAASASEAAAACREGPPKHMRVSLKLAPKAQDPLTNEDRGERARYGVGDSYSAARGSGGISAAIKAPNGRSCGLWISRVTP